MPWIHPKVSPSPLESLPTFGQLEASPHSTPLCSCDGSLVLPISIRSHRWGKTRLGTGSISLGPFVLSNDGFDVQIRHRPPKK